MVELIRSATFDRWLSGLRDRRAVARVAARLDRLAMGHPGDAEPIGNGISQLQINHGPGYRVYYAQAGKRLVLLLAGGDKRTQQADITAALTHWHDWQQRRTPT